MEQARDVCRKLHGLEKEKSLYNAHRNDMDEYIFHACNAQSQAMLCQNCKTKSAVVEMLQTRSADEGMTAFIVCQNCSYRRHFH